ncbi:pyruvate formate lyase family protein [Eubacteriaceae bacterium ES3]|nr:pyruvate formate lyase family protein [Eubacteriaceae bacterium ES3]
MSHTTAIGTLPFDHPFKAGFSDDGFSGREEGFSTIPRTNRLRKAFLDGKFEINSERALLVTEAYKANESLPIALKRGKSLRHVLENISIYIYEDELVAGCHGAPNKYAAIFPEFSYNWVMDEMENFPFEERVFDNYEITEETKNDLRSIADYWKGRTIDERIVSNLSFDEAKGSNMGIGMYLLNLYQYGGIGHYVFNYKKLLEIGYGGLKQEILDRLAEIDHAAPDASEQRSTLQGFLETVEGAMTYIARHAEAYEEKAAKETDARLKEEYTQIAKNLRQVTAGPATNFWEAAQLVNISTMITYIESNGHSISYGRYDDYMYPYYKASLEKGEFTKEFMQEIVESHFIKMGVPSKLRDKMTAMANTGRGFGGESLTIGGVDRDGNDITNDLTFMCLDASAHTRMMVPWTCVRMSEKTPEELKVKTVSVIKAGFGHPKVFNDQACVPAQMKAGRTLEDAREYNVVGCVEPTIAGREFAWADAAYFNIARVLEVALNDGQCYHCGPHCPRHSICAGVGKKLGLSTGSLETFKNIDEVKASFEKQLEYFTTQMVAGISIMEHAHRELGATPYASVFFDNCIVTAKDMSAGGVEFNHTGPQGSGLATTADGLSAIDQIVFKQGKYTGKEMLDAVKANWEGHDKLYALVNSSKIKHYGNDDDYADEFGAYVFNAYCDNIENKKNTRGGTYKPGVYGVSANVAFGLISGASIDGRKIGEPISDNMGPVHTAVGSHDIEGPTAIANSVTKMDHSRAGNGTLLNWKFNHTNVSGQAGTNNLVNLIDTYFDKKGMHSQFNIMSTETMKKAQANPEDYKDMLVRVAGYSAYFVELSTPLQNDLISRTELSFE